jgi:hypothetical protein
VPDKVRSAPNRGHRVDCFAKMYTTTSGPRHKLYRLSQARRQEIAFVALIVPLKRQPVVTELSIGIAIESAALSDEWFKRRNGSTAAW